VFYELFVAHIEIKKVLYFSLAINSEVFGGVNWY